MEAPGEMSTDANGGVQALLTSARRQVTEGSFEDAVNLYRQALRRAVSLAQRASIQTELGWLLYEMSGTSTEPLALARSALKSLDGVAPDSEAWLRRGVAQSLVAHSLWLDHQDGAEKAAHEALESLRRAADSASPEPVLHEADFEAARLLISLGDAPKAAEYCHRYLDTPLEPRDRFNGLLLLAEALRLSSRWPEALEALSEALALVDAAPAARPLLYFTLGLVRRETGDFRGALEMFEKSRSAVEPRWARRYDRIFLVDLHRNIADLYYHTGRYAEAAAALQVVLAHLPENDPHSVSANLDLAHCYLAMDLKAASAEHYDRVLNSPLATASFKAAAREGLAKARSARP